MNKDIRPTCVTVIGWAWIVIGSLMFASSIMALFAFSMMNKMGNNDPNFTNQIPPFFKLLPYLSVFQSGVAITGVVSGVKFLKLKSWSRNILEILSWLMLLFMICFGIFWEYSWISMSSGQTPQGFDAMGAIMGLFVISIYSVPLAIMLKYLRGEKIKNAMNGYAEQSA